MFLAGQCGEIFSSDGQVSLKAKTLCENGIVNGAGFVNISNGDQANIKALLGLL